MKKSILLLTAAMTMTFAAHAADTDKTMRLRFTDLPYAEGTLYIAVSCGGEHVMATAIEVSGDSIIIPLDLAGHDDKTVSIQAFQDLNSNSRWISTPTDDRRNRAFRPRSHPAAPMMQFST